MKNKLGFLIKEGLKRKFKTKSFKVTNIILIIIIPLLINIDSIINYFGGDFTTPTEVYIIDDTKRVYDAFITNYEQAEKLTLSQTDVNISESEKEKEELINTIKDEKNKNIVIHIKQNQENIFDAEVISYEHIDALLLNNITSSLNNVKSALALEESNIDINELNEVYKAISIEQISLNEEYDDVESTIKDYAFALIPLFIIPFFLIVIFAVQMIGAEINEEKTSKSMEIIISSVSPTTHFISKLITVNVFIIIQSLLILLYGVIGLWIRTVISGNGVVASLGIDMSNITEMINSSSFINEILIALPFVLLLIILSIIAYSLLAGILASMTTSIEDFQQLQTPLMIIVLIGYYLAIMASTFENATFITVFSFIPFISALLAPALLLMGQIGLVEIIISLVLLIIVIFLFLKYGIRIYKVGILNYGSSKLWTKMFKAIKGKKNE